MIKKWKHLDIHLPRENDLYTFKEVLGELDQYNLELFIPQLDSNDVVIDLGSHIGLFSLAIAEHVKKVISLEPDAQNFAIQSENIATNRISNILAINKAIAKENGKQTFFKSQLNPARNSFYPNPFFNRNGILSECIEIPTISLSSLLSDIGYCKLLKSDIEGAEYEVFFNTPEEDLKKIKIFLIEYHNLSDTFNGKALESFFSQLGFQVALGKERVYSNTETEMIGGNLLILNPFI